MLIRAAQATWDFLIALAEAKHEYYKKHGYNGWY